MLNSVVKFPLMFAHYFEYYGNILRGAIFSWTHCSSSSSSVQHNNNSSNPFNGPLSRLTQVSWYQTKHSLTHPAFVAVIQHL